MSPLQSNQSEPLTWDLSPTDFRTGALLRYLPFLFLGGYAGIALVAGALAFPALLANPELLALVALLVLVGGPTSLLYLWPMIRDPDQRAGLDPRGWYEGLSPLGVVLASVAGTVLMLAAARVFGGGAHLFGVVVFMLVPFLALGLLDGEGRLDPDAGTLTYREFTTDITHVDGVRAWTVGSVTLVWLGYVDGASGPKPRLFAVPGTVADGVVDALQEGAGTPADVEQREPDRLAQAVLGAVGLLFVAVGAVVALSGAVNNGGTALALVFCGIGFTFFLAAWYIA